MFFENHKKPILSGVRFAVTYHLTGEEGAAYAKAQDICLEQTVEFPGDLLPEGPIAAEMVGHIEDFRPHPLGGYFAEISYAVETTALERTQLFNVMFGNISLKPGIRVADLALPPEVLMNFKGPRFGRAGIREILKERERPLLFTALKPMGLSPEDLAELAYQFALGGIDIIKDDHGLSNQAFSPFEQRTALCAEAVRKANGETGGYSIFVPNITAPHGEVLARAAQAKALGAGGLLISPGLTGFDAMGSVAEADHIGLPVFAHPAFLGSYCIGDNGIAHGILFGCMMRLAGADASIYPNFGGRFSFTREECREIAAACDAPMGDLKAVFPCPAGGMSLQSIPASLEVYGTEVTFLIGGGLFRHSTDLVENCRYFRRLVEQAVQA
jgi:ribulose-bisphosphate carboxylase large chain